MLNNVTVILTIYDYDYLWMVALISTARAALAKYLQMSAAAVFHFSSWEDVVSWKVVKIHSALYEVLKKNS